MKIDIKYINRSKPRKTMSNITFKEDVIHPAHSIPHDKYIPYVPKKIFDGLVQAIEDGTADAYLEGLNG